MERDHVDRIVDKISSLGEQGRHEEALALCDKMLKTMPKSSRMYMIKAAYYKNLKEYDKAMKCIEQALEYSDKYSRASCISVKAEILYHSRRYSEAIELIDRSIHSRLYSPNMYALKGLVLHALYSKSMDKREAMEILRWYDKSLEYELNDVILDNKGRILYNLGRYNEAIECYERALSIKPENDLYLESKAASLFLADRLDESIECCRQVIKLGSKDPKILFSLACTMYNLDLFQEALDAVNTSIKLDPTSATSYELRQDIMSDLQSRTNNRS